MTNLLYEGLSKKRTTRKTMLSRQFNVNTKLTFYALWSKRCILDINKDPFCLCSKHLLLCTTAAILNQSEIVDNIVVIITEINFNYYLKGNFTVFKLCHCNNRTVCFYIVHIAFEKKGQADFSHLFSSIYSVMYKCFISLSF